jgi:hypothetical protein
MTPASHKGPCGQGSSMDSRQKEGEIMWPQSSMVHLEPWLVSIAIDKSSFAGLNSPMDWDSPCKGIDLIPAEPQPAQDLSRSCCLLSNLVRKYV